MKHFLKEYAYIPITIAMAWFVFFHIIIIGIIPTQSMEPTYMSGSFFVGLRLLDKNDIERGTPVIFHHEGALYVKRIVGLPGDVVAFCDGVVLIDGAVLNEPYLYTSVLTDGPPDAFSVPNDCYLMLGDNRSVSYDARYWPDPYTPANAIVGRILFTIKIL